MARLNLTLDEATIEALERDARKHNTRPATRARHLISEALERNARLERARQWAAAYRADRADARRTVRDMEPATLEILGEEDA